ncbi:MAG: threonine/homoserine/homoserine lactone efflux protein [Haloarculaceae archaeon]|jgi:threonine/homoserine/homoserine lactone efflux protein
MAEKIFDRETILDLTVNIIPLGILLFFLVAFTVYAPFGFDSVISTIQFAIVGVSAFGLAVLTYYSGKAISKAENEEEEAAAEEMAVADDGEETPAAEDTDHVA